MATPTRAPGNRCCAGRRPAIHRYGRRVTVSSGSVGLIRIRQSFTRLNMPQQFMRRAPAPLILGAAMLVLFATPTQAALGKAPEFPKAQAWSGRSVVLTAAGT